MLKDHQIFSTSDRVSLLSDAFTSSRVGSLSYDLLFKFCSYLHNEKDYLPLITATSELAFIEKLLRLVYINKLSIDLFKLLSQFPYWIWKFRFNSYLYQNFDNFFINFSNKPTFVALKFSSAKFWELSWKRWLNETDPNIKSKMLRGLSLTKDGDKIMFLHQQIIDGRNIKSQVRYLLQNDQKLRSFF